MKKGSRRRGGDEEEMRDERERERERERE